MPDNTPITLPAYGMTTVDNTPHPADIIETGQPHLSFAVAVTENNGLQVTEIASPDLSFNPPRAKGTRAVSDLASFLAELERRPLDDASTLWGNADQGALVAIYNDHDGPVAGWRDDMLVLKLKKDADWAKWHDISGKPFRQVEFGDIIEDLLHTVTSPDQADLLEIIDSVRASSKGEFQSGINRANGSQSLTYNTEVTTSAGRTGQLTVPQTITLSLRPWEGHPQTYDVGAYFRLSIQNGQLALAIKLKPTRMIVREAWDEITTGVTAAIGKPVYAQP